jgi:hypothetical protein
MDVSHITIGPGRKHGQHLEQIAHDDRSYTHIYFPRYESKPLTDIEKY